MPEMTIRRSKPEWTIVALGNVVQIINQYWDRDTTVPERLVAGEHIDEGDLRVRRWAMTDDELIPPTFNRWFQPGDVLLHSRNIKKVAQPEFGGITGEKLFILRSKDESELLQSLLPYIVQSEVFRSYAESRWAGSTNKFLNKTPLQEFEFALPPIEEQRRLVAALSAAEAAIDTHRSLVETLDRLRKASVDQFTGLSGGEIARLGEHCEMQNGRPFPGDEYCDDGVLLLRPGNLSATGYLDWEASKTKRVPARYLAEAADFLVGPGDVVINLTAQSLEDGFMGRVCLARERDRCLLNQRIGRFTSYSSRLLPEYLYRTLQSGRFKAHTISMCEGSKVKHLFWQHLDHFVMRLPHMDEQRAVAGALRDIDQRLAEVGARVLQLEEIKDAMLVALADTHGIATI